MLLLEPSMHGSMWTQPCRKDAIDIKSLQVARTAWPDALSEHIKKNWETDDTVGGGKQARPATGFHHCFKVANCSKNEAHHAA